MVLLVIIDEAPDEAEYVTGGAQSAIRTFSLEFVHFLLVVVHGAGVGKKVEVVFGQLGRGRVEEI